MTISRHGIDSICVPFTCSWLGDAFYFVNPVTGVAVSRHLSCRASHYAQGTLNITQDPNRLRIRQWDGELVAKRCAISI